MLFLVPCDAAGAADPLCVAERRPTEGRRTARFRRRAAVPDGIALGSAPGLGRRSHHRGDDGSTGLDRYRAQGGTEARVGEILGAGPDLAQVEKGWLASAEHRDLALARGWTHAGWGSAASGSSLVTVMMFTEKKAADLEIMLALAGLKVSGRFISRDAVGCVLFNGLEPVFPGWWDPTSRGFRFDVPGTASHGYLRLGYLDAAGRFTLTNAFTWPPGTGSPGAEDRFSSPAPSP